MKLYLFHSLVLIALLRAPVALATSPNDFRGTVLAWLHNWMRPWHPIPKTEYEKWCRDRADAIKEAFVFAWDNYYHYCFPDDELHPVSNTCGNSK